MIGGIDILGNMNQAQRETLRKAGIDSVVALLEAGRRPAGRRTLADATEISKRQILRWVHAADLLRIRGLEVSHIELMHRGGIESVHELRNRNPKNLAEKLEALNQLHALCERTPEQSTVRTWIESAKALPLIVEDCFD